MDLFALQDHIDRSLGIAARAVGIACDAFRPTGPSAPLSTDNRFLRINAAFSSSAGNGAVLPASPVWQAVLDAAYIQPGDYLVECCAPSRTWFMAAAQPLLPRLCVLTNVVVSVTRAGAAAQPGAAPYGGSAASSPVIDGFPASLLHGGTSRGEGLMPADTRQGAAAALLPPIPGVVFARGDMLRDALGRSYVVNMAEPNSLGWRLDLRQAAS